MSIDLNHYRHILSITLLLGLLVKIIISYIHGTGVYVNKKLTRPFDLLVI